MTAQPSREDLIAFAAAAAELERRYNQGLFYRLFPDRDTVQLDGTVFYSRHLYPKHLELMRAGTTHRERCFLAGNRIGKTTTGGFETSSHLTGLYRPWWEGRRFHKRTRVWAAGKTNETTRDIVQKELLGEVVGSGPNKHFSGTGLIPGDRIGKPTWKQGVTDFADTVRVGHEAGGWSTLGFKSYQQGRSSFEGTAQDFIWLDEEPPQDVYGECLIRTATTQGCILLTFTPLEGLSKVVLSFTEPLEEMAGERG